MALFRRGMHFGSYGRVDDGAAVFGRLRAAVELAEASGFDAISLPDHLQQNEVGGGPDSPMFDACNVVGDPATVRHKFDVLERHCERAGRDPAEITKTVFVFAARDLAKLATDARAFARAGADGITIVGPEEPDLIPAIGAVLGEAFPG